MRRLAPPARSWRARTTRPPCATDAVQTTYNYTSGLRVFTEKSVPSGDLREVAWFDVYPENDAATFEGGTWSNYSWFDDGIVGVSSIDRGFFVLKPRLK